MPPLIYLSAFSPLSSLSRFVLACPSQSSDDHRAPEFARTRRLRRTLTQARKLSRLSSNPDHPVASRNSCRTTPQTVTSPVPRSPSSHEAARRPQSPRSPLLIARASSAPDHTATATVARSRLGLATFWTSHLAHQSSPRLSLTASDDPYKSVRPPVASASFGRACPSDTWPTVPRSGTKSYAPLSHLLDTSPRDRDRNSIILLLTSDSSLQTARRQNRCFQAVALTSPPRPVYLNIPPTTTGSVLCRRSLFFYSLKCLKLIVYRQNCLKTWLTLKNLQRADKISSALCFALLMNLDFC
ncbi:uncharacterized protein A4U43_C02F11070 [Asparagus officinalis]|uniref:Uncharacterized protein n=1 Tax=Asparagus officinalis TaxID=4686 RepID=A0A5P1FMH9_ASPOF|nr:uncharacterized protein A4U43_C02F11070 [Asparagus officinalis]